MFGPACVLHMTECTVLSNITQKLFKKNDDKIQTQTNNIGLVNQITAWMVLVIALRQLKLEESPPHDQSNQNPRIVYIIYAYTYAKKSSLQWRPTLNYDIHWKYAKHQRRRFING